MARQRMILSFESFLMARKSSITGRVVLERESGETDGPAAAAAPSAVSLRSFHGPHRTMMVPTIIEGGPKRCVGTNSLPQK